MTFLSLNTDLFPEEELDWVHEMAWDLYTADHHYAFFMHILVCTAAHVAQRGPGMIERREAKNMNQGDVEHARAILQANDIHYQPHDEDEQVDPAWNKKSKGARYMPPE